MILCVCWKLKSCSISLDQQKGAPYHAELSQYHKGEAETETSSLVWSLSFYSSFELYAAKCKKNWEFNYRKWKGERGIFPPFVQNILSHVTLSATNIQDFNIDDKHFSLHTKFIFLWHYLKYPLNANCIFTLEGKAKLFLPASKQTVPGECMFSTLCAQTAKLPAPALITWSSESKKQPTSSPKKQIFVHLTTFFSKYRASPGDQLQFRSG